MLKNSIIYISLLDYLIEVKNKFWVIIITFILFMCLSFLHAVYKENFYTISLKASLIKLTSLSLKGYNLQTDSKTAIRFISDSADSKFNLVNTEPTFNLKCLAEDHFLSCVATGKIYGDIDIVKKNLFNSLDESFDEYETYFVTLIDGLISSHERLHEYVVESEDANVETNAKYKSAIEEATLAKQMFETAITQGRPTIDELFVAKHEHKYNYRMVFLSSIICALFLIFIQMKRKEQNKQIDPKIN